jgi:hypothetical protein
MPLKRTRGSGKANKASKKKQTLFLALGLQMTTSRLSLSILTLLYSALNHQTPQSFLN